jgi:excisionase family DNA binding protein
VQDLSVTAANRAARRWASFGNAADHVGVTPWTIRRWVKDGRLKAYRFGPNTLRIDLTELDALGGAL